MSTTTQIKDLRTFAVVQPCVQDTRFYREGYIVERRDRWFGPFFTLAKASRYAAGLEEGLLEKTEARGASNLLRKSKTNEGVEIEVIEHDYQTCVGQHGADSKAPAPHAIINDRTLKRQWSWRKLK